MNANEIKILQIFKKNLVSWTKTWQICIPINKCTFCLCTCQNKKYDLPSYKLETMFY